jgi:hypothetical protein
MKTLVTVTAQFTAIGQVVTVNIPNLSEEAAFRMSGDTATISLVMIADPTIKSTHSRSFQMIGTDVLPVNFVKYIGTFPFPKGGPVVHVIEVTSP